MTIRHLNIIVIEYILNVKQTTSSRQNAVGFLNMNDIQKLKKLSTYTSRRGEIKIFWVIHADERPVNHSLNDVCGTYTCAWFAM